MIRYIFKCNELKIFSFSLCSAKTPLFWGFFFLLFFWGGGGGGGSREGLGFFFVINISMLDCLILCVVGDVMIFH